MSSIATRRMVEALLGVIEQGMAGTSIRVKNASARVWGYLSAISQDERSDGDPVLLEALGWGQGGGTRSGGPGNSGGPAGSIAPDALNVAREGSLMSDVLRGLQAVATGGGYESLGQFGRSLLEDKGPGDSGERMVPELSSRSLFARSALKCLESCSVPLRVPHPQMAAVLAALFKGGYGSGVEAGSVSLAVRLASRDQAYPAWLRGLMKAPVFGNLSPATRGHLVAVFADVLLALPAKVAGGVVEEAWDNLIVMLPAVEASGGERGGGDEGVRLMAAFFCGLARLAGRIAPSSVPAGSGTGGAGDPASAAALLAEVSSMTTTVIVPAMVSRYDTGTGLYAIHVTAAVRRGPADDEDLCAGGDDGYDDLDPEARLLGALTCLLRCIPQEQLAAAVAFDPTIKRTDYGKQVIRGHLIARLASEQPGRRAGQKHPAATIPCSASGILGSVVRWAVRTETPLDAGAAVLSHVARSLGRVSIAGRLAWLRMILDVAGLSEVCPLRALALLASAALLWEPSSAAFLALGESGEALFTDHYQEPRSESGKSSSTVQIEMGIGIGLWAGPGTGITEARGMFCAAGAAVPKAVMRVEGTSPGAAGDVLARLLRLSDVLGRGRISPEVRDARVCVDGFIRGLRHAPPVSGGAMSQQFAAHARVVSSAKALADVETETNRCNET